MSGRTTERGAMVISAATARRVGGLGLGLVAALALSVPAARAGTWMEVSCVNPDGSAAPSQGWTPDPVGFPEAGSLDAVACAPGAPMTASLSTSTPAAAGTKEALEYVPPAGSAVVGGELDVKLAADSTGTDDAVSGAGIYEPALVDAAADSIEECSPVVVHCQNGGFTYVGPVTLPASRGGEVFANAECVSTSGSGYCQDGPLDNAWALAQVYWAHLLLATSAVPEASGFAGSALAPDASGTAHLVFTATDINGPGVYQAHVSLDGRLVYSGTPDANGGACAPVGTDPATGAPMYDSSQPCPVTANVDVPVPTAGLPDGPHELSVSLTDAAGTTSPVLDQTITTYNPQTTPAPRGPRSLRARFVISWSWLGSRTVLRSLKVSHLPRAARVSVNCRGHGCPKLKVRSAGARRVGRLLRALTGKSLQAGDVVRITVTAPGHRAERIELVVRNGAEPRARLLKP